MPYLQTFAHSRQLLVTFITLLLNITHPICFLAIFMQKNKLNIVKVSGSVLRLKSPEILANFYPISLDFSSVYCARSRADQNMLIFACSQMHVPPLVFHGVLKVASIASFRWNFLTTQHHVSLSNLPVNRLALDVFITACNHKLMLCYIFQNQGRPFLAKLLLSRFANSTERKSALQYHR